DLLTQRIRGRWCGSSRKIERYGGKDQDRRLRYVSHSYRGPGGGEHRFACGTKSVPHGLPRGQDPGRPYPRTAARKKNRHGGHVGYGRELEGAGYPGSRQPACRKVPQVKTPTMPDPLLEMNGISK